MDEKLRSIGIRVSPKCIYYCVAEEHEDKYIIINADKINVPIKMDMPFQLRHVKTTVESIIKEYNIKKVGIRVTENNARSISIPRLYLEGVIIETLANCSLDNFFIGTINRLASLLKEEPKSIKKYIDNVLVFKEIDKWSSYSSELRESIISAIAALNL